MWRMMTMRMRGLTGRGKLRNLGGLVLVLVFLSCVLGQALTAASARNCLATSPLVGLSADLAMVQHQLRGVVDFVDDCTFKVTEFDMIVGKDVHWWGSAGIDLENMTRGFSLSLNKLNQTYQNDTLEVSLDSNYTWDNFKVLSVWDTVTASDFGHIFLEIQVPDTEETSPQPQSGNDTGVLAPAPGPDDSWIISASAPMPVNETAPLEIVGYAQPTMFDKCVSLSKTFRLRWTVNWDSQTVDLGLEGALTKGQYMAFGWARPGGVNGFMLGSDVVVAGVDEKDIPYADDYYLGDYKVCNWDVSNPIGVCPDYIYSGGTDQYVNSNKLVYGQQTDGITLIRYQRPLSSADPLYDVSINVSDSMQVVWAIGGMNKPLDMTKGNRTPQNHMTNFGYRKLTLGDTTNECLGPLVSPNDFLGEVVVADRGAILVVGVDTAVHYPDPPFPQKVLYINQKEAPLLRVERGVPVTFSVQAGHGVAFYVTDNPVGAAFSSNVSQTIYAGGPDIHGVPVTPSQLIWEPNRTTPDLVYYQDYYMEKRGWEVEVVDGGLSDMYNQSSSLAENVVTLFWTVSSNRIYMAVRGEVKSNYVAIAFGSGMVNSFSYVGWVNEQGTPQVNAYWMDGKKASSIHATGEELSDQKCVMKNGIITFEFSRPLEPSCSSRTLCKNVIDPEKLLKVVWAMGDSWTNGTLEDSNMHADVSTRPTLIHLLSGASKVEQLQPVLAVHGFMMFIAWGLLLPGGVLGARYLKHLGNIWLEIHVYSQLSAVVVMLLGLLFAAAELHGIHFHSAHMKVGLLSILVALAQALNGYLRPKNALQGESQRPRRVIWQYIHQYSGRSVLVLGFVALVTGISELARRDGVEGMRGLQWALFAWFLAVAAVVGYIEVQGVWNKRGNERVEFQRMIGGSEDDTQEMLAESHAPFFPGSKEMEPSPSRGMEIQLEALH